MDAHKDISGMMNSLGMVPVFYHDDTQLAVDVLHACYEGGLRLFEFTNRGKNALSVFEKLQEFSRKSLPDLLLGAGSVINGNSAEEYITAGADFIVSPLISDSITDVCRNNEIMHIPGCGTVTEVGRAQKSGALVVKLFPAEVMGPSFIRAVLGPMPWSKIMPTGGVTTDRENLKAWFDAGAYCVGMGSSLFTSEILREGNMALLTRRVSETLQIIREVRNA